MKFFVIKEKEREDMYKNNFVVLYYVIQVNVLIY